MTAESFTAAVAKPEACAMMFAEPGGIGMMARRRRAATR